MFQIANGDTKFNEWEQALAALLSYEFKCKRQAEWQLFGDDTGTLSRPTWTNGGTDEEAEIINKLATMQMAARRLELTLARRIRIHFLADI